MTTRSKRPGYSTLRPQNTKNGKPNTWALTVPRDITKALLDADLDGAVFKCEMHPDGILFRFINRRDEAFEFESVELPAWAKNGAKS